MKILFRSLIVALGTRGTRTHHTIHSYPHTSLKKCCKQEALTFIASINQSFSLIRLSRSLLVSLSLSISFSFFRPTSHRHQQPRATAVVDDQLPLCNTYFLELIKKGLKEFNDKVLGKTHMLRRGEEVTTMWPCHLMKIVSGLVATS